MVSECILGGESQDSDDRLELYALGRLPAPEVENVEEHLLICDFCRDRLDELAAFAFSAREALKEAPPNTVSSVWRKWFPNTGIWRLSLAMAATAAVLMLAIGMYRVQQREPLAPVAALHLTAVRSALIPVAAPSRELDIDFTDARDAAQVIVLNAQGSTVWTGVVIHGPTDTRVRIQTALPEGEYFARAYAGDGTIIYEYAFRIAR
jgi:hypothetical protein